MAGDNLQPMLAAYSSAPIDIATDLAIPLLARRGVPGVTPSAVAGAAGCTRQAVHQWFGGQQTLRVAVAGRFVARWSRWMDLRVRGLGPVALLPLDDDELQWTAARLALAEQGRVDPELGPLLAELDALELSAVRASLGAADEDCAIIMAVVGGLRAAECRGHEPLTLDEAQALLQHALARLA